MIRTAVWKLRQRFGLCRGAERPLLDHVNFGTGPCTVLDVGAYRGGFAGEILVRAPLAEVHCFEPNSRMLDHLRLNARRYGTYRNKPRCVVNPVGVADVDSEMELTVTQMEAASSFLPLEEVTRRGWPGVNFDPVETKTVRVIRLETYLNERNIHHIKLLKLDVQGLELGVLRGCGDRLRDMEYLVIEVQFVSLYSGAPLWNEVVDYARHHGFEPVIMGGFCFAADGSPLQADILLSRRPQSDLA